MTDRIPARELGPAGVWQRLVDLAMEEEVHALVLAGDVVEAEHDFFEAYRQLRDGVERLVEAGVRVLAVAGNHDTRVLPYLADQLEGFELLGREGVWKSVTVTGDDEEVTVHGWSFPRPSVRTDPVAEHRFERGPGPNLGLLHCDRNKAGTSYAPVPARALEAADLDGWLLGHIHRPDSLEAPRPSGYLGSLTGLDPGEPGPRGPWLLTVDRGGIQEVAHLAIGPLRWLSVEVDVEGIEEPEEARIRVMDRFRVLDEAIRDERTPPRAVGARLTLGGRTRFWGELEALFEREDLNELAVGDGSVLYFVERLRFDTLPEIELEEFARRDDPAGLLARRLLLLDRSPDDPERKDLVDRAHRRLVRTARDSVWGGLESDPPDRIEIAEWLRRAGRDALVRLVAQEEER